MISPQSTKWYRADLKQSFESAAKRVQNQPQAHTLNISGARIMAVLSALQELEDVEKAYADLKERQRILWDERRTLADIMREAIDNCETCRSSTGTARCARCQSFEEALTNEVPF